MKRFLALAALVLGLAACQTEPEGLDVNVGGEEQIVTINVTVPETETRAGGGNSAKGVFDNGVLGTADDNTTMRYILQVYYKDGENFVKSDERKVEYSDGKKVAFDVRLVPERDYQFVVWADVVVNGKQDIDNHYVTKDANGVSTLNNITLNGEWNAMDESRDAFTATEFIDNFNGSKDINITLKRPFAKLRVVTTDIKNLTNLGIVPTTATVEYTTTHRVAFNALEGKAADASESKTHSYTINPYSNESNTGAEYTLFTDYFFAENDVVKFNFNVYEDAAKTELIKSNSFQTDINVKANYLTTIKGNILTDGKGFEVKIEDGFVGEIERPVVEVHDANSLQDAINNAEDGKETTIIIGGDIDLDDLFGAGILSTRAGATLPIVIAEGKTLVLDLNGCKISAPFEEGSTTRHFYAFDNKGTFTIMDSKGGGQIIARGNYNYGNMTLESGSIVACDGNGGYAVQHCAGEFVMNGGSISTSLEDGDLPGAGYDATTLRVEEGATATINDGTITNVSNFTLAIDNYGTTTIKDGTFTSVHTTIGNHSTMTIDGGSFTCNGLEGITAHALWADAGTTTINGGTFDGKDNYNGFNVDASEGAVVNIYGGKFLPVHSGSLYGDGSIVVKGGEFFDNPTARVAAGYESVKENDVWTVKKMTEEAKLRKVLAEGGEVTLEEDITIAAKLEVKTTEAIVVNGNNKTINYKGSDRAFDVNGLDTANVTLNDLTFVNTESYCQRGINFNVDGTLTLNNVTVGETGTPATYAINLPGSSDGAEVVITNSYFCGNIALNVWGENATINATDSEFVSYDGAEHEDYAAISLNNDGSSIANGTTIDIAGGKVIARDEKGEPSNAVRNSTMTGEVTISDSTEVVGTALNPVAAVIYEGYNEFYSCITLKEAIDKAIETKGSVRLIKDIEVDETITIPAEGNVTIDLNDKTISGTMHKSVGAVVKNEGTLTVKNGTIKSTADNGGSAILNYGTIVVEDVTLNGAPMVEGGWPSYAVNNYGNLTVNSATINTYHGAIATGGDGVAVIKDATVDVGQSTQTKQTSWALYVFENGQLTVNNGTFKNTKDEKNKVYGGGYICATSTKETVINGGTFDKTEGDNNGNGIYYNCTNLIIKGGTFDTDPSKHISEGYAAVNNENGTWTVIAE